LRTRRHLLVTLGTALLTAPFRSLAEQKEKVWVVGVLAPGRRPASSDMDVFGGLVQGLRELGYVEGWNLKIEWRFAEGQYERLPDLAAELVGIPVDIIVADGAAGTVAAQKATKTIPIVFSAVVDVVGIGIVKSLARPGGNTTGNSLQLSDTADKQMELLKSLVPGLSRLAVLYNPANTASIQILKRMQEESASFKVTLLPLSAKADLDIVNAFSEMTRKHAGAFIWIRDSFLNSQRQQIADLALKHRLPGLGGSRTFVEVGGLVTYAQNGRETTRHAATYVDKILKGANPGDLPVEQPTKLELVINRKTAKALGLTIPAEMLLLADKVIE
jgi:putative tryptophan/tyrosine transport system substrate-binding protein